MSTLYGIYDEVQRMKTVDEYGRTVISQDMARALRAEGNHEFIENHCIVLQPWQGKLTWPIRWNRETKLFENAVPR